MTRWEILKKAKEVLEGKCGDGRERRWFLGENYKPVQRVVDAILDGDDYISKEIEKRQEEIRRLEEERKREEIEMRKRLARERALK